MTVCVVDASVTLSWTFEDEASPYADSVFALLGERRAVAPAIWLMEVSNGLLSAIRQGRLGEVSAARFLTTLYRLPLDVDVEAAHVALGQRVLELGLLHGLTSYDASYLELAIRRGLPLATQDRRLASAASRAGVAILQP